MSLAVQDQESQGIVGIDGLIDYLRTSKHGSGTTVEELSAKFNLRPEFVKDVLEALRTPQKTSSTADIVWKAVSRTVGAAWERFKLTWLNLSSNPGAFLATTGILGYLLVYFLVAAKSSTFGSNVPVSAYQIFAAVFLLHYMCFARHGKLRYPIFAACVVAVATLLANVSQPELVNTWGRERLLISSLATGALYGFLGSVAALIGGFVAVNRRDRSIRSLSRQEALDRLFDLKERFTKMGPNLDALAKKPNWLGIEPNDPKWPLLAFMGGFVFGILRVLVLGGYVHLFNPTDRDPVYKIFMIFSFIVTASAFLGIGYLAGAIWKSVLSQFIALAGLLCSNFFKLGGFGPEYAMAQLRVDGLAQISIFLVLAGLLTGAGARVEEAARRERRRNREDPASMIAEMIMLERRLNSDTASTCVMSVDIARSTAMKAERDPLVVEWSFREYQKMLRESAEQGGGFVLATSGDGAVLTFSECGSALTTARDIQTRLGWFNMRVNRLDSPFRVRIGIHSGAVQGDLNDVQFAEVIDIAAHVQTHAPVGGILVTEPVSCFLPEEEFTELKDPVEGLKVFVVVNPTIGA